MSHCSKCKNPWTECGNRNCRCHPIESRPVLDDLRKQARLRANAIAAGERPSGDRHEWHQKKADRSTGPAKDQYEHRGQR